MSSISPTEPIFERLIARWKTLDRGWQATLLAIGVTVAVLFGVSIPW